jgi:hypothetical protein
VSSQYKLKRGECKANSVVNFILKKVSDQFKCSMMTNSMAKLYFGTPSDRK